MPGDPGTAPSVVHRRRYGSVASVGGVGILGEDASGLEGGDGDGMMRVGTGGGGMDGDARMPRETFTTRYEHFDPLKHRKVVKVRRRRKFWMG